MKKILILKPRLDIMFKKGPVSNVRGAISAIREHWENFVNRVEYEHLTRGDIVRIIELPLWQFSPEIVDMYKADITYIPHKEKHSFNCGDANVLYYMQMVFPHMFMVDPIGWGAGASNWPIQKNNMGPVDHGAIDKLKLRIKNNISKFDQPQQQQINIPKDFIFFPCQIPHDETIKFHSDVSVADALQETINFAKTIDHTVVVKGHPVNPTSCQPLKNIAQQYDHVTWVENASIHDLLADCQAVVTV